MHGIKIDLFTGCPTSGERLKTDINRLCPFTDAAVIRTTKRDALKEKKGINKSLSNPQCESEYPF